MNNCRKQKTLLALLISMNSYNFGYADPVDPAAGNEVRTGVNEIVSEPVVSDEMVTFQFRPDFVTPESGSLQVGNTGEWSSYREHQW